MLKLILRAIEKKISDPVTYARKMGVQIGDGCKFNGHPNFGTEPWLINIGNHVELSGDVCFITHDGATWVIRNDNRYKDIIKYGKIIIHDNCFIGNGTCILPGCEIGENVIVGARSLVTTSLESNSVYVGSPAKKICSIHEYAEKTLKNALKYDMENYKIDKKEEIIRALNNRLK